MPPTISIVMITLNEEKNLQYALRSVSGWASEILVIDMHSDDRTVQIAREFGAKVHLHERVVAFDGVRAFGVGQAQSEWILVLDADEIIPQPLSRLLIKLATEASADVFKIPRLTYIHGRPVWHTGWGPTQDAPARFFKRGKVALQATIHSTLKPSAGATIEAVKYKDGYAIQHFSYIDFSHFLEKLNLYTSLEAQQAFERHVRPGMLKVIILSFVDFMNRYIRRRGYKDGWHGFYLSGFYAFYRWSVFAKLQEHYSTDGQEKICQLYADIAERLLSGYKIGQDSAGHFDPTGMRGQFSDDC